MSTFNNTIDQLDKGVVEKGNRFYEIHKSNYLRSIQDSEILNYGGNNKWKFQ